MNGLTARRSATRLAALVLLAAAGALPALAAAVRKPVEGTHGMVVSVSRPSADVGREVLRKGGNAVDAAVATAFALAVTYPAAGNIGGGGFMVVYPGGKAEPLVIEYRETAPAAATKTMYTKDSSPYGHKAVGVPGSVHGLALAHRRFGKLPWKDVVRPAVKLAEEGFALSDSLASSLNGIVSGAGDFPELRRVYGKDGGDGYWQAGDRLVQKELAATLRAIADQGPDVFYRGWIADKIAEEMRAGGGLITKADLAAYHANVRAPVHGTYRGYDVYAPPPPSSGGTCLVEMLNVLENFDLSKQGRWSPETLHLMIEAMRRGYCDRARYLGDPDFTKVPAKLTSKEYARELAHGIDLHRATRSEDLAPELPLAPEGDSTTHFSVIDQDGMAVANTTTLERSYGSRVVVRGCGFLLNDEMIDFNWRPAVTARDGTIGTEPNQIAPGKRMLSSQTPTVVARDGKVVLITGSPGSRTIINTVLGIVVSVLDFDMDVQSAVDAPRLHHQWFPDRVRFEGRGDYPDAVEKLRQMGHTVEGTRQGDAHSIWVDPKTGHYFGAADGRISGYAAGTVSATVTAMTLQSSPTVESSIQPLQLGPLRLSSRYLLAPLAGYTNLAFRLAVREVGGLGLATTDLVNARALLQCSRKTMELIQTCPEDRPLAVQIYGANRDEMCAAARWLEDYGVSAVDINMGCPVHKVTRGGGGSALLCDPGQTVALVRAVVEAVAIPVTVKMRLGWDEQSLSAPYFARAFEEAGVAAVTIHGRTRAQGFGGTVNLEGIRAVVEAVDHIPVLGNGDVRTLADAEQMLAVTGCAGIAIGRGALLNPWFFAQLCCRERTGEPGPRPTYEQRLAFMDRHFHLLVEQRGERFGCLTFRKVANWYCKVLRPGRLIQQQLVRIERVADFAAILAELRERGGPGGPEVDVEMKIPVPKGPIEHW